MKPASLQHRLLAWVAALVAVVWVAAAVGTWVDARHELDELLDGHLAQAAALLVVQQVRHLDEGAQRHADERGGGGDSEHDDARGRAPVDAPSLHRYAPQVAVQVFHEGHMVLRSALAPTTPMRPLGAAAGFATVRLDGIEWRVFGTRGAERDVDVIVGERLASRESILHAMLRSTGGPLLLALPLLLAGVWWAVRQGVGPLRALGTLLARRQPASLEPVALPDAPLEMRPMLDALNGLLGRIGALREAERRFTADAAHELRTPIAAIRAQAQVALAEPEAGARQHALRATLAGCDRATRLVEQLLTLARLDEVATVPAAPHDLVPLVRQLLAETAPRAMARQQTLSLDAPPSAPVRGDPVLLAVLARNLVDNALRYSPPGAEVRVNVLAADSPDAAAPARGVRLQIDDSGPGLAPAELERLGERFFRVLGSGESGSGLGWSIVRRIAAAQGAQVHAERSALGGLRVRVDWPPAGAA